MGLLIIGVTLIVLIVSILITANKSIAFDIKKLVLMSNLGIFALILLIQKIIEPYPDIVSLGLQNNVYTLPSINQIPVNSLQYSEIPEVNDYLDLLESNLEFKFDAKNKMGPIFSLITGQEKTGKSFAIKKLAQRIVENGITSGLIYVDLAEESEQENIQKLLGNLNYLSFKDFLTKYSSTQKPSTIIIDHFELATNQNSFSSISNNKCYLCTTLRQLYIEFNVNIILVSNSPYTKKILDISGVSKFILKKQFQRSLNQEIVLLKNIVNSIEDVELLQKLGQENIEFCFRYLDFQFDHFQDFLKSWKNFQNYKEFCELQVEKHGKKYLINEELKKTARFMLDFQKQELIEQNKNSKEFRNNWVSYGYLKHKFNNDYKQVDIAIQLGLDNNLFEQQPGQIRFFSKLAQTSAIVALMDYDIEIIQNFSTTKSFQNADI